MRSCFRSAALREGKYDTRKTTYETKTHIKKTPKKYDPGQKKLPVYLVFENVARLIYTKGVGRGNLSMSNRKPERARADLVISLFFGNISFC
jgi:hypothetical protein